MKSKNILVGLILLTILTFSLSHTTKAIPPQSPAALSTAFSYQGYLSQGGAPANGAFDFEFRLYDALSGGTVISGPIQENDLAVVDGYFTVSLNFGGSVYTAERWLEIAVRPGAETGSYTVLAPRQALAPAPFALSVPWSGITGVPAGFADGVDNHFLSRPVFSRTQLDGLSSSNGYLANVTIGSDGLPLVAYLDGSQNMKVLHCLDLACTSAENHTISSAGLGWYISIAIGADGLPVMVTTNNSWGAFVVHCDDLACASSTITNLESCCAPSVRNSASIAIGVDGLALMTYHRGLDLKTAHCSNLACTSFTGTVLASGVGFDGVGEYSSVAIGVDGLGLISYFDNDNDTTIVAHCNDIPCSTAVHTVVDTSSGPGCGGRGITIGSDGLGLVVTQKNTDIEVVHCSNTPCTSSTLAMLPSLTGSQGLYAVVAIGSDGLPLIAFSDLYNNDIVLAHCADYTCTQSSYTSLSTADDDHNSPSLAIGTDGMPFLAYTNTTDLKVEVMHCSNPLCIPFWQRP